MNPTILSDADKTLLTETTMKFIEKARSHGHKINGTMLVNFSAKLGATAGRCSTNLVTGNSTITYNIILFNENKEKFLATTTAHEVAHHLAYNIYKGQRVTAHGRHFKHVMQFIIGVNPNRCHTYDITNAVANKRTRTVSKPYIYKCGCSEHKVTKNIHNKMANGQTRLCCSCHAKITFVGIV